MNVGIHPILIQCWPNVFENEPTLKQHWVNALCLAGGLLRKYFLLQISNEAHDNAKIPKFTIPPQKILLLRLQGVVKGGLFLSENQNKTRNEQRGRI